MLTLVRKKKSIIMKVIFMFVIFKVGLLKQANQAS